MKLYEIAAEYRSALAAIEQLDLDEQTVSDTLEGLQGELDDKLRAVIAYSLELDIQAAGAWEAAKRMKTRADTLDKRAVSLRQYALAHMQATGRAAIHTDEWTAKLAKTPPRVVLDESALPDKWWRISTSREPAKSDIAAALKAGNEIPGASLVSGERLLIK